MLEQQLFIAIKITSISVHHISKNFNRPVAGFEMAKSESCLPRNKDLASRVLKWRVERSQAGTEAGYGRPAQKLLRERFFIVSCRRFQAQLQQLGDPGYDIFDTAIVPGQLICLSVNVPINLCLSPTCVNGIREALAGELIL